MKKRVLIQTFEKVKTQTKCEAARVIDRLSGVVGDPLNEKKRADIKPEKRLFSKEKQSL